MKITITNKITNKTITMVHGDVDQTVKHWVITDRALFDKVSTFDKETHTVRMERV